jgi:hypothetical protein
VKAAVAISIGIGTAVLNLALSAPALAQAHLSGQAPDRQTGAIAAVQRLSESDLKAFYVQCSSAAMRRGLGGGDIALCSVGYELLLKRAFRGDFLALLMWSKSQPTPEQK